MKVFTILICAVADLIGVCAGVVFHATQRGFMWGCQYEERLMDSVKHDLKK